MYFSPECFLSITMCLTAVLVEHFRLISPGVSLKTFVFLNLCYLKPGSYMVNSVFNLAHPRNDINFDRHLSLIMRALES